MAKPHEMSAGTTARSTLDPTATLSLASHNLQDIGKDASNQNDTIGPKVLGAGDTDVSHLTPRHRFLSRAEWIVLAHGVGAVSDAEQHQLVHPAEGWWPPRGMAGGLYKSVVFERTKFFYLFHVASVCRWALMIIQLLIGAALTALGPQSLEDGTPITVLGAINTINAGLLALLHNSGLPDRYRYNKAEFEGLEDHIRELLDTGLVPADKAIDQVLAECFDIFQEAKATVQANMPVTYNAGQGLRDVRQRQRSLQRSQLHRPMQHGDSGPRATLGAEKTDPVSGRD